MRKNILLIFGQPSTALEICEIATQHHSAVFDRIEIVYFESDFLRKHNLLEVVGREELAVNYIIAMTDYSIRAECERLL